MSTDLLAEQHRHLARLLEAIQRSAWFLHESEAKIDWPIEADWLGKHKKDVELFETLAAINERFAKLQDTLASAMRHSALLMGEHFNLLHQLSDMLYRCARQLLELCDTLLDIRPASDDFTEEFNRLFA